MLPKISSAFVLIMRPLVPGLTATFIYSFVYFGSGQVYFQILGRGTALTTGNLTRFVLDPHAGAQTLIQLQEFNQQMSYLFSCCAACLLVCVVRLTDVLGVILFAPFCRFKLSQLPLKLDFLLIDHSEYWPACFMCHGWKHWEEWLAPSGPGAPVTHC